VLIVLSLKKLCVLLNTKLGASEYEITVFWADVAVFRSPSIYILDFLFH
jgi:hypothetical protein